MANKKVPEKVGGVPWEVGKIGSINSLASALNGGYYIEWFADGYADVHKPDGDIYQVRRWSCDCPAGEHDKTCKHVLWVSQLLGCGRCSEIARYGELTIYSGAVVPVFACRCGQCRPFKSVVKNRKSARLAGVGFGACVPGSGRIVAGQKAYHNLANKKGVADAV